jgi:hypothetical protein
LAGCANGPGPGTVAFDKQDTRLVLLTESDRESGITKYRPESLNSASYATAESAVILRCASLPSVEASAAQAVLGLLLGSFLNVTFEKIDQALQDEIKKYSQAYSASRGTTFYRTADAASPEKISTETNCVRFVRAHKAGKEAEVTYVDFIAQVRIVNQSWLEIRPLRLYFSNPVAKSSNGRYGLAFKLKATTVHRDAAAGARALVFDDIVLTQKVEITAEKKEFVKYYYEDADRIVRVPLPPYSTPVQNGLPRDFTTFELSVAETGVPGSGLIMISKIFAGSREEIAKVLAAAANEHLGWAEDE